MWVSLHKFIQFFLVMAVRNMDRKHFFDFMVRFFASLYGPLTILCLLLIIYIPYWFIGGRHMYKNRKLILGVAPTRRDYFTNETVAAHRDRILSVPRELCAQ